MTDATARAVDEERATATRISLREELGASAELEFELRVPDGWERFSTDEAAEALLQDRLRSRMMQTGRPDLMVGLRRMLTESFEQMRQGGAAAVFMPMDPEGRGYVETPTTIMAVLRKAEPGATLDDYVTHAIRTYGAEPLFGDLRTIRFETETERELDGETIVVSSTHYVTPMPGSRRARALELVATYGRPSGLPRSSDVASALHALFDVCASTVRWVRPERGR
ncbi:MAG: protein TPRXL [Actinomycetota bacterium]